MQASRLANPLRHSDCTVRAFWVATHSDSILRSSSSCSTARRTSSMGLAGSFAGSYANVGNDSEGVVEVARMSAAVARMGGGVALPILPTRLHAQWQGKTMFPGRQSCLQSLFANFWEIHPPNLPLKRGRPGVGHAHLEPGRPVRYVHHPCLLLSCP